MVRIKWHSRRAPAMIIIMVLAALIFFGTWLAGAFHVTGGRLVHEPKFQYETADRSESTESEATASDRSEASYDTSNTDNTEAASTTVADGHEPTVEHAAADSPDGKYRIETYGTNRVVTAGGLFPAEGIRLVDLDHSRTEWSMSGYYKQSFLWSPDSRYVSVSYMARIWGETIVVDTSDFSEMALPSLNELLKHLEDKLTVHEQRPDPYTEAVEWLDDTRLSMKIQWSGIDSTPYSGTYIYDVSKRELVEIKLDESD